MKKRRKSEMEKLEEIRKQIKKLPGYEEGAELFYYYREKNDKRARIAITITALAAMVSVATLVIRLLSLGRG